MYVKCKTPTWVLAWEEVGSLKKILWYIWFSAKNVKNINKRTKSLSDFHNRLECEIDVEIHLESNANKRVNRKGQNTKFRCTNITTGSGFEIFRIVKDVPFAITIPKGVKVDIHKLHCNCSDLQCWWLYILSDFTSNNGDFGPCHFLRISQFGQICFFASTRHISQFDHYHHLSLC